MKHCVLILLWLLLFSLGSSAHALSADIAIAVPEDQRTSNLDPSLATLISGCLTALSTLIAVLYTCQQTRKQLKRQAEKYEKEKEEEFKRSKYVLVKPTLMMTTFTGLLERLIHQNDYNRMLLFSGKDGFDFFDDPQKRQQQTCRTLQIENDKELDIKDIKISTKTTLKNEASSAILEEYNTVNNLNLLRKRESIVIRIASQEQFEHLCSMNVNKTPNTLNFECLMEYTTQANQRITYSYSIEIKNDQNIKVRKDGVESATDVSPREEQETTDFRNLQDYLSSIDRSKYIWEKMGASQMQGIKQFLTSDMGATNVPNSNTNSTNHTNPL